VFATKKSRLSVIAATFLTFSLISSSTQASANSVPEGQHFGIATCCGDIITVINGSEYEVGQLLNLEAFVDEEFFGEVWLLDPGDSAEIIGIVGSGNWIDFVEFEDEVTNDEFKSVLTDIMIQYDIVDPNQYVSYRMDQNVAGNYSTAIFSVSGVRTKIVTPALRQTSNLSFDQSFYGSDQISDPTGEISNLLKEINRKYGNLISIE
jgi:hypothetical protein